MAELAFEQSLDVDADAIWDVVKRFDYPKLVDWLVSSCEVTGHEVGDERTMRIERDFMLATVKSLQDHFAEQV